jgi:peptidoglycan/LPS O-acetylase OafA/YrhL
MAENRIQFAHLLRGVAAVAVVVSHLASLIWRTPDAVGDLIAYPASSVVIRNAHFTPITDFGLPYFWGYFGVALFFLVSGFVIPRSVSALSRSGFIVARIFRIWPTYLIGLTIAIVCIDINTSLSGRAFPYSLREIIINALIVPRWPTSTPSIDGIIWTLEIEICFYVICMMSAGLIRHFDRRIFVLAAAVVPLGLFVAYGGGFLMRIGALAFGVASWISTIAVYITFMLSGVAFYNFHRGRLSRLGLILTQTFLLLTFVAGMRIGVLSIQGWTAIFCYLIAFGTFAITYAARDFVSNLPRDGAALVYLLADISYPLYAVHAVLGYTVLVYAIAAGIPGWAAVCLAAALVLTCAALIHFLVEMPSQHFGKALAAKMPLIAGANTRVHPSMCRAEGRNDIQHQTDAIEPAFTTTAVGND